mgnify:CR=1 FL=1
MTQSAPRAPRIARLGSALLLLPALAVATVVAWPWRRILRRDVILPFVLAGVGAGVFFLISKYGQPGHLETLQESRPYLDLTAQALTGPKVFAPFFLGWHRLPFTLLALAGLWLNRHWLREVFAFRWWHVPVGVFSALVLYLMFFVGDKIAAAILPFASEQVALVYRTRSQADLWLIGVLLFAWVGPAEEIFWRGFLLRWLTNAEWEKVPLGRFSGMSFLLVTLLFTLAHPEWLAAAVYCALLNGFIYWKQDLWSCVVAHGVSNLLLGLYVLTTEHWWLW